MNVQNIVREVVESQLAKRDSQRMLKKMIQEAVNRAVEDALGQPSSNGAHEREEPDEPAGGGVASLHHPVRTKPVRLSRKGAPKERKPYSPETLKKHRLTKARTPANAARALAWLEENPGARIPEIAAAIDRSVQETRAATKKLRRDGFVRMEGDKSHARYFPTHKRAEDPERA